MQTIWISSDDLTRFWGDENGHMMGFMRCGFWEFLLSLTWLWTVPKG